MLETLIVSSLVAVLVSGAVNFALSWQLRIRVGRLELESAELHTTQLRHARQRAAAASVDVRSGKMTKAEMAQLAALTQQVGEPEEAATWPLNLVGKDKIR